MLAYQLIERKRNGGRIEPAEWQELVGSYLRHARQRGQLGWNIVLARNGEEHLSGGFGRQQPEHPCGAAAIEFRHRVVEQEDRVMPRALAMPGAFYQP